MFIYGSLDPVGVVLLFKVFCSLVGVGWGSIVFFILYTLLNHSFRKALPTALSVLLVVRYLMFINIFHINHGWIVLSISTSALLLITALINEFDLSKAFLKHPNLNEFLKALTYVTALTALWLFHALLDDSTLTATVTYMVMLTPTYIEHIKARTPVTSFITHTILTLLMASDIRELVILFWLNLSIHKYTIILEEHFLIWVTALIIMVSYGELRINNKLVTLGVISTAIGNILQIPPIINYIATINPLNIWGYFIRLTPVPFTAGLMPKIHRCVRHKS